MRAPQASSPGLQPQENGFVESFNGRLRYELLNESLSASLAQARRIIEDWRIDHNGERQQTSLNGLTPIEFELRSNEDHNQNGLHLFKWARRGGRVTLPSSR